MQRLYYVSLDELQDVNLCGYFLLDKRLVLWLMILMQLVYASSFVLYRLQTHYFKLWSWVCSVWPKSYLVYDYQRLERKINGWHALHRTWYYWFKLNLIYKIHTTLTFCSNFSFRFIKFSLNSEINCIIC